MIAKLPKMQKVILRRMVIFFDIKLNGFKKFANAKWEGVKMKTLKGLVAIVVISLTMCVVSNAAYGNVRISETDVYDSGLVVTTTDTADRINPIRIDPGSEVTSRILWMSKTTVDGNLTVFERDTAERINDASGRLLTSNVMVNGSVDGSSLAYAVQMHITAYNGADQVLRAAKVKTGGGVTITTTDTADRTYDDSGRLLTSNVIVNETVDGVSHVYAVQTHITAYNAANQVLRTTQVTVDGGVTTTTTDTADRTYDDSGRLLTSNVIVSGGGNDSGHPNTMKSDIDLAQTTTAPNTSTQLSKIDASLKSKLASADTNIDTSTAGKASPPMTGELPPSLAIQAAKPAPLPAGVSIASSMAAKAGLIDAKRKKSLIKL